MNNMGFTIVKTPNGDFRGNVEDGIKIFRGINYANCERFQKPEPMNAWYGEYDATQRGTVCPQRSERMASEIGDEFGSTMGENELHLSIYSPEKAHKCPVMVWIHGGSYLKGGSEERRYSGRRLVKTGNLIVVKISYRLGALGYLWWNKGEKNLGLEDQKLALEWIYNNISYFGGDKNNICLFGQSAGAHSIASIIADCQSTPPFKRVIMQSPPLGLIMKPKKASHIAKLFLNKLGKDPYKADIEEILDAQTSLKKLNKGVPFMPVLNDCSDIPATIVKANIEMVVGYASYDSSPLLKKSLGPLFNTFIGKSVIDYFTKTVFIKPIEDYVRKAQSLGLKAQTYIWDWYPQGSPLKACHSIELPFILGNYEDWKDTSMLNGLSKEEYDKISDRCLKAWTNFAIKGEFTDKD